MDQNITFDYNHILKSTPYDITCCSKFLSVLVNETNNVPSFNKYTPEQFELFVFNYFDDYSDDDTKDKFVIVNDYNTDQIKAYPTITSDDIETFNIYDYELMLKMCDDYQSLNFKKRIFMSIYNLIELDPSLNNIYFEYTTGLQTTVCEEIFKSVRKSIINGLTIIFQFIIGSYKTSPIPEASFVDAIGQEKYEKLLKWKNNVNENIEQKMSLKSIRDRVTHNCINYIEELVPGKSQYEYTIINLENTNINLNELINIHSNNIFSTIFNSKFSQNIVFSGSLLFDIINDNYSNDHKDVDLFLIGDNSQKREMIYDIISKFNNVDIEIYLYKSIVQIIIPKNNRCIQLICTNYTKPEKITDGFDFSYLKMFVNNDKLYMSFDCIHALNSNVTQVYTDSPRILRVYKALKNGMVINNCTIDQLENNNKVIEYKNGLNKHKIISGSQKLSFHNYKAHIATMNVCGEFTNYIKKITVVKNSNNLTELKYSPIQNYGHILKINITDMSDNKIIIDTGKITLKTHPLNILSKNYASSDKERRQFSIDLTDDTLLKIMDVLDDEISNTLDSVDYIFTYDKNVTKQLSKDRVFDYDSKLVRPGKVSRCRPKIDLDNNMEFTKLKIYDADNIIPRSDIKTITQLYKLVSIGSTIQATMQLNGLWINPQETKYKKTYVYKCGVLLELKSLRIYSSGLRNHDDIVSINDESD